MRCPSFTRSPLLVPALLLTATTGVVSARPEPQAAAASEVLVDFRVVTEDGQPVADLKPADVTLRVGGRPRAVKSLELVRVGGDGAAAKVAPSKLPPPFFTNAAVSGSPGTRREVLVVLDELSISPGKEPTIREALGKLLAALAPSDRVAVMSTRQGGTSHAFTVEHESVRGVLTKFAGHAAAQVSDADYACNAQLALNTLKSAFAQFTLSSAPTLVYVSAALSGPGSQGMASIGSASELCTLRTNHFEDVGVAAQASRANVYVVHALEASSPSVSPQKAQIGIDAIAGTTGAETIRLSGGTSLGRIASETSAYYLAAFDAEPADRSGNRQRVEVRVARDRVRVNARPNIVIAKADAAAAGGKPVTPADMIRVATTFTDLPLRAATYTSRNPDGKIRVVALFEPVEPATKLNAVSIVAYDAKGSAKAQWKGQGAELASSPVRSALIVDPGTYRIRIAATDAAGRAGTVDIETRAEMAEAGSLKMSALVLGTASGAFAPKLLFDAGDQQAIGYVEIYGVPKEANVGVTFELAEGDGGPAIATGPAKISAPTEDSRIAFGGFGIGPMEPGDLQMRAVITLNGKPIGSVSRTLRKMK